MMKLASICFLTGLLALGAMAQSSGFDAAYRAAANTLRAKQYGKAIDEAQAALKDESLSAGQKAKLLRLIIDAGMQQRSADGLASAKEASGQILSLADVTDDLKAEAGADLAEILMLQQAGLDLKDMDPAPSEALLLENLKRPGLSPKGLSAAHLAVARFHAMQARHDLAREHFHQAASSPDAKARTEALEGVAAMMVAMGDLPGARQFVKDQQLDPMGFALRHESVQRQDQVLMAILRDEKVSHHERWRSFTRAPALQTQSNRWGDAIELVRAFMPAFATEDAKRGGALLNKFRQAVKQGQSAFIIEAAPYLLSPSAVKDDQYNLTLGAFIDALASLGRQEELLARLRTAAGDDRADARNKAVASIALMAMEKPGPPAGDVVLRVVSDQPAKQQLEWVTAAAQTLLRSGRTDQARQVFALRDKLVASVEPVTIVCRFSPAAPYDIGSWLASPMLQEKVGAGRLDRPYGDNLRFLLETDATNTGRGIDAQASTDDADTRTDVHVACDAQGISIFLRAYDSKAAQAMQGVVRGGSYEMYIAPGPGQPYHTFLAQLTGGEVSSTALPTMYPNLHYRELSREKGNFTSQWRPMPDGFAHCLFISWEAFYDKLPEQGQAWQFEAIRWTRAGGRTLAGSQSVHNRSSWASLLFDNMTREDLAAIKRNIIARAVVRYAQAKLSTGVAGQWADTQLGDPVFHQAKVKPLLDRLDELAAKAKGPLTVDEVDSLYQSAVPAWMDMEQLLMRLRRDYLRELLLAGN